MSAIKLYFVTGGDSLISRVIRGACMGFPYSHVGAILPSGLLLSAHANDGVQIRTIAGESPWSAWATVTIPCSREQSDAHTAWLLSQVGRAYDMAAIGAMADGSLSGADKASGWTGEWICSDLQFEALAHPGVGLFPWRPANLRTVTPEALMWGCTNITGSAVEYLGASK